MELNRKNARNYLVLLAATMAGVFILLHHRTPVGQTVILSNGTELTLFDVTFGREHVVQRGSDLLSTLLRRIPRKLLARWQWAQNYGIQIEHARFGEPRLALWFISSPPKQTSLLDYSAGRNGSSPRSPRVGEGWHHLSLRWKVIAAEGSTSGGTLSHSINETSRPEFLPVFIESYPRRQSKVRVQLLEAAGESEDGVVRGEFAVKLPKLAKVEQWTPEILPVRKENRGVTCTLTRFIRSQMSGSGDDGVQDLPLPLVVQDYESVLRFPGSSGTSRSGGVPHKLRDASRTVTADFDLSEEQSSAGPRWEVRQFRLLDCTENFSFPTKIRARSTGEGRQELQCETIPLWPDEAAWKIQLDLARAGDPASARVLRLSKIAFPFAPKSRSLVVQTNFLGYEVSVYISGVNLPNKWWQSIEFECSSPEGEEDNAIGPMLRITKVTDQTGAAIPELSLHPDMQRNPKNWSLDFNDNSSSAQSSPQLLDVAIAFVEQRHFEFFVQPPQR